jgi:hypothetical protein
MKKSKKLSGLVFIVVIILLATGGFVLEGELKETTKSRERSFLSLSVLLMQLQSDESELQVTDDRVRKFSQLLDNYVGLSESEWSQITYGKKKHVPAILFESGNPMRIYESKNYPIGLFRSDRLEVHSNDYVVRWVKSVKIVKP